MKLRNTLLAALGRFAATAAHAEIKVGVVLGHWPLRLCWVSRKKHDRGCCRPPSAAEKVSYIVLDDAFRFTTAVKNARKLTVEDGVDDHRLHHQPRFAGHGRRRRPTKTPMISIRFRASWRRWTTRALARRPAERP